ncbi:RpoD/SigA family RNA polymerase sigma factor [Nostoc sp. FACHB-152]|uniref:RpoD/SigA family RNA polymerase sigma factor n=1 Tax=unclassified Nostoc TaxID=2593658 RepID=UPI0016824D24|nr:MULTISPECIES: RpoD/SigA family RNA polymerase sigma factor [unclassified Nostoc]MBD2452040.1 RpoD/SigA family RNA polymerase sigma factor [Nostoc sp. FACHB-152]MBD2469863.1 RpoD/SigA family RNA polymerase sigma factor [Nostoc sp. FACHB-145]
MTNLQSFTYEVDNASRKYLVDRDNMYSYLQEIGKVALLTHQQEIVLAQQVQQMMHLLNVKKELALQLKREPLLHEWADYLNLTIDTLQQQLNQGRRAKQKMIAANLRLVVSIAKKYQQRNMELLDLIQEGNLALERGIEKFDPERGYKLSTYAYWWIRQGITRAIAQQSRTIRLPIHVFEKLNKIKRVQRELSQKLGRVPTTDEIATALSLTHKEIRECLYFALKPMSLESRIGVQQDSELIDVLEDTGLTPESYIVQESLQQDLQKLLAKLTPQQREVLTLRFGLKDGNELSLSQIGQRIGVSRERIRQIEQQALKVLRQNKGDISIYIAS